MLNKRNEGRGTKEVALHDSQAHILPQEKDKKQQPELLYEFVVRQVGLKKPLLQLEKPLASCKVNILLSRTKFVGRN
jgi:hypothetical protein